MKRREDKQEPHSKREKRGSRSSSRSTETVTTSASAIQVDSSTQDLHNRKGFLGSVKNAVKSESDLAERIDKYEEEIAESSDPQDDLDNFKKTCENLEAAVKEINRVKSKVEKKTDTDIFQIAEKRSEVVLLATQLRKLNRRVQIRGRKAKESTSEVKKKVDACHLDLQNLLYEIMHMKQEITKCTDFTSKDEEIELVSIDDFYAEAPQDVSKPEVTKGDPHKQMLARLDWELKQRQQMTSRKDECAALKQELNAELQKKASCLKSAEPGLGNILKVGGQLLDSIGFLEASKTADIDYEMAQFLPQPLYGLYVQAKSYQDVWDKSLVVNIEGDVQEAKADVPVKVIDYGDDHDEDLDADDQGEEGERENEKHRKSEEEFAKFRLETKRRHTLHVHPLHILLVMRCEDGAEIKLSFFYFTTLKIVTVKVGLRLLKSEPMPIAVSSPLLAPDSVLDNLYDNDDGKSTPNPANLSQLENLGIQSFSSHTKEMGVPYYWVQWLCWLKYLPITCNQDDLAANLIKAQRIENVLAAIKERILVRMALQRQLTSLEKLEVPSPPADFFGPLEDPISRLSSWKSITEEEVKGMALAVQFNNSRLLENAHSYYLAAFERREGTLACIVVLHTDYPYRPPLFILKVKMKTSKLVEINCVREMEKEINICRNRKLIPSNPSFTLTAQLRQLQIFFDIFCETQLDEPSKNRLFINAKSGRDRRNPLTYVNEGQLKLFVHDD